MSFDSATLPSGTIPNPENLKMLALRHFGSCGYLREFCGNLRDFARVIPMFSVAAFTLLNPWTSNCLSKHSEL